jgi:YggT family protein
MTFSRGFSPSGALLVFFEIVYTTTDPPLRLLRRVIPPLRIGGIAIDLGFLILFILVQVAISYAHRL